MSGFKISKSSPRFYRRISFGFIGLTLFLLFIVMYMALSRATIVIEPQEESVTADLLVSVKESSLRSGDVLGKIGSETVSRESIFNTSGSGSEVPALAQGEITVYNKHIESQTLIKTTRFLSKEGVLFRLSKDITVPSGGSVKAIIQADQKGASGNIEATIFTIPGLAKSLQAKIHGESESAMTGGMAKVTALTQKDIDDATANIKATLILEAKDKLKTLLNPNNQFVGIAFKDTIKTKEVDTEVGEQVASFSLKLEIEVVGVAYSSALEDQAAKTLSNMLSSDKKLISSNVLELDPTIEKYDLQNKVANFNVALSGKTVVNASSHIFDKQQLAGKTKQEINDYLSKNTGIKNIEISFFPFWMDRVPKLRDHIKVVVK